jgi:hypothetical protein
MSHDHDEPIRLRHDGSRNLKQLDRPARLTDRLDQRVEARVLGIEGDAVIRTLIRAAILGRTPTSVTALPALTVTLLTAIAATGITAVAAGPASIFSATTSTGASIIAAWTRTTVAGKFPPLAAAARWPIARSTSAAPAAIATGASRSPKGPTIPPIRGAAATTLAPRPFTSLFMPIRRGGLLLRPLRAEAKALQLAQIEFVEIRGRIFLGGVVVHVIQKAGNAREGWLWSIARS